MEGVTGGRRAQTRKRRRLCPALPSAGRDEPYGGRDALNLVPAHRGSNTGLTGLRVPEAAILASAPLRLRFP